MQKYYEDIIVIDETESFFAVDDDATSRTPGPNNACDTGACECGCEGCDSGTCSCGVG
jgi:hypothetical protein